MFHFPEAGVDASQNTSWHPRSRSVSRHMEATFRAQASTLPPSSGSESPSGSSSFGSSATLRPSPVILSMLSTSGSTAPLRTSAARSASSPTASRCSGVASTATGTIRHSGRSSSMSEFVLMSA